MRRIDAQHALGVSATASIDSEFRVGFVHRLRRTSGAFEGSNPLLGDLLEPVRLDGGKAAAFLDSGVAHAHAGLGERIGAYIAGRGIRMEREPRVVPGGEEIKNEWAHVERMIEEIDRAGLCRKSVVVAVGGGAVLDAVGLAASLAHRGVRLIRVPTTTVSQGDSGVGVKNGVNLLGKKNMVGCFAPPLGVVNDTVFLETLEERDWRAGFSEAIKVGLVKDGAFFEAIESAAEAIAARDLDVSVPVIDRSAEIHLSHITEGGDPFETRAARPLDFGHWAAHKIEAMTGYGVRHGEAVAIGIAIDTLYSAEAGRLGRGDADRVLALLRELGFGLWHPVLDERQGLLRGIEEFREHLGGTLAITLLRGIGSGFDADEIDHGLVGRVLEQLRERA